MRITEAVIMAVCAAAVAAGVAVCAEASEGLRIAGAAAAAACLVAAAACLARR